MGLAIVSGKSSNLRSLRGRLVGTLFAVFAGIWAIVGIYLGMQFAQARSSSLDDNLDQIVRIILLSMPSDIDRVSSTSNLQLRPGEPARLIRLGRVNFQVWVKSRRENVVRSAGAPSLPFKPDFADGFATVNIAGEEWRVCAITDARNQVQVQVGKPTSELAAQLRSWLCYGLALSLFVLLVLIVCLKLVVHWSLRPVMAAQAAITSRKALDLTPIPDHDLPSEVRPLVESFNGLLERLDDTLRAERRFFTEAAHELRTPLAVLLTHAQVAQRARTLEESRTAVDQVARGVERSARLSQQLLDSARLDVERHSGEQTMLQLADVVVVVTREFEMAAAHKSQTITLNTEPGAIRGNLEELGILVRNLLDNALRYAGPGCGVKVSCKRIDNLMLLEVRDNGPGVAPEDRERIFDRFYRGIGQVEPGSGIGLALVSRIAQSHDATIRTGPGLQGRGFGISVAFRLREDNVPDRVSS